MTHFLLKRLIFHAFFRVFSRFHKPLPNRALRISTLLFVMQAFEFQSFFVGFSSNDHYPLEKSANRIVHLPRLRCRRT